MPYWLGEENLIGCSISTSDMTLYGIFISVNLACKRSRVYLTSNFN